MITERTINRTIQRHCQHCTQMTQEVDKQNTHKNNTKKKSKRMINMDPHQIPGMNHRCLWRYGHINLICLKQTPSMRASTMYMYIVCPWQAMGGLTYMSTTNWSETFIQHILHSQRVVSLIRYALPAATSFGGIVPINGETRLQNWNGSYIVVTVLLEIGCHILNDLSFIR